MMRKSKPSGETIVRRRAKSVNVKGGVCVARLHKRGPVQCAPDKCAGVPAVSIAKGVAPSQTGQVQGGKERPAGMPGGRYHERFRDGMRRCLITFIDPASALTAPLPARPGTPLGRRPEFGAGLAQTLEAHGIGRRYSCPKPPKITAHIERFNRTLQESFVDYHEDPLFTGFGLFNQKLADWLVFDSTKRLHHRLGQQLPLRFLLPHHPECQR